MSARKVATAIGYTVGTLYLVFENLDDLILQINARTLDRLHARMAESQAISGDARDYLLHLGQAYIQFADDDPHRWAMVFEHRLSEGRQVPALVPGKDHADVCDGRARPGAAGRTALSQQEITQAAAALWGGVHGICILALTDNLGIAGVDSVQELTESLIGNYLEGFTGD